MLGRVLREFEKCTAGRDGFIDNDRVLRNCRGHRLTKFGQRNCAARSNDIAALTARPVLSFWHLERALLHRAQLQLFHQEELNGGTDKSATLGDSAC